MTDLANIKNAARKSARSQRKAAFKDADNAPFQAAKIFLDAINTGGSDVVALYRAIQSELDPAPLAEMLHQRGITLCYPVVKAAETPLEFRAASPQTKFIDGAFGAAIPDDSAEIVTPTIVLAPLLAWDRALYRLGYGGGFYDRTLEALRKRGTVQAFGYAFAAQETDEVPIDPYDQRLDGIVTEQGFIT